MLFLVYFFGGIRTVKTDSIYNKILTVIMDYCVTFRKFLEFIIFLLSTLSVKNPSYLL